MATETNNTVDGRAQIAALVQAGTIGTLNLSTDVVPPPCQLPPSNGHFADRLVELERVRQAAGQDRQGGPLVVAVTGIGGIGKTALGFHIARQLGNRFPDGVLYVDLDDIRREGVVELADAVGELLDGLGVTPEWRERSLGGRTKQYWTRSQGKRLLVVVDNVRHGAEAVPLLPASPGSLAVVTSHGSLYDLGGADTVELALGPLAPEAAVDLLRGIVDDPRLAAEPEALADLVGSCAGLPAALHVAGQWVRRHRRRSLGRLVAELSEDLHRKGIPTVEAVWDAAVAGLGPEADLLYRLLPEFPAPAVTPPAAAALLGGSLVTAEDTLEELESAGLLECRTDGFRMHALLRGHAERRARQADPGGALRVAARGALIGWLRRQAARADLLAAGSRMTFAEPWPPVAGVSDVEFPDKAAALRWLEENRLALYGAVRRACETGMYEHAWALCEPLWTHFLDHQHYADVVAAFGDGIAAAESAGDLPALVRMRCQLARPLWEKERYAEAAEQLDRAFVESGGLGDSPKENKLKASVVEFRGRLRMAQGDWAAAATDFEDCRGLHAAIGNAYGVLLQNYQLGLAVLELGEAERAVGLLQEAHRAAKEQDRARMAARTGFGLGRALRRVGRTAEAVTLFKSSLDGARARASTTDEARVLYELADAADELGLSADAEEFRTAARHLTEAAGGVPAGSQSS